MDVLLLDWGPAGDGPEDEGQDGQPAPHPEHQEEDGGRRGEGNDAGIATTCILLLIFYPESFYVSLVMVTYD